MGVTELCVGRTNDLRVGKAAGAGGAAGPELVSIPLPLEVARDAVVGIPVVVEASRHPSALEEVADGSRTKSRHARQLERHPRKTCGGVAPNCAGLRGHRSAAWRP